MIQMMPNYWILVLMLIMLKMLFLLNISYYNKMTMKKIKLKKMT